MIINGSAVVISAETCSGLGMFAELAKRMAARDGVGLRPDAIEALEAISLLGRTHRQQVTERLAYAVARSERTSARAEDTDLAMVGWLDIATVARLLGCKPRNALALVVRHNLGVKGKNGRWWVDPVSFQEFASTRKDDQ
jgi:hypothetical protein